MNNFVEVEFEELYHQLAENITEVFFIRSLSSQHFIYISPAFEEIWGFSSQRLLDNPAMWRNVIHPEDEDRVLYPTIAMGRHQEFRIVRPDGDIRWIRERSFPVPDKKGNIYRVAGIAEDITEKKRVEIRSHLQEQLILQINENVNEGIYRSKANEGIIYANKAFARLFGYDSVDEIIHAPLEEINSLYVKEGTRSWLLDSVRKHGSISNKEILYRKKDGSSFWGLESSTMSKDKYGETYIDGTIIDITEKKESEELLRLKNEELEKINQELDRFIYSASHDLRAPLSSLLGLISLAAIEDKKQQYGHFFDLMRTSVNRMDHFIKDIVDYSKNSRLELQIEKTDVREMTNKIFSSLNFMPGAINIEPMVFIDQQTELFTDSTRLNIVLNNVIANAFKYHDLRQETPFVEVNAAVNSKEATIVIKDNGKGIDPRYIDSIFNMFFRATEESKGSGLGLYIVKEAVKKLEGEITVESQPRVGTTFTISIPNHLKAVSKEVEKV